MGRDQDHYPAGHPFFALLKSRKGVVTLMYNPPVSGIAATSAAAGTGLAFTGFNVTFAACVAVALLAAGLVLLRIVPRLGRSH